MKPLCRHCSERKVTRPRGLCWKCYYTPGVRELYGVSKPKPEPDWRPDGSALPTTGPRNPGIGALPDEE